MSKFKIRGPLQLGTSVVFMHEGSDLMEITDERGNMLGISFNADGTFTVGGWTEDGEWVELKLVQKGLKPFALNQYEPPEEDDDPEGVGD